MAMRLEISNCQFSNWTKVAMITALGLSLSACQSVREATGVAKLAPDEFTVLTKAPLIVPPDYNLRPPQPGAADRNLSLPADMARNALFQQQDAASAAARTRFAAAHALARPRHRRLPSAGPADRKRPATSAACA